MTALQQREVEFCRESFAKSYRDIISDHLRAHTIGTNVSQDSLLTTDYLNHFNEVVMLLHLLPTAPMEIAADLSGWKPKTYEEHFEASGFRDRALAIAGYQNSPDDIRHAFDTAVGNLERELVILLRDVEAKVGENDIAGLQRLCDQVVPEILDLIDVAADVVNHEDALHDSGLDDALPDAFNPKQAAVDALFD